LILLVPTCMWVFKVDLLPISLCALLWLKHAMAATLVIVLALIALMLLHQTMSKLKNCRRPSAANKEEQ